MSPSFPLGCTRRIKLTVEGRTKSMTLQEVIIRNLTNEAARGNLKALSMLFTLWDRYRDSSETTLDPASLPAEDRAILDEYLANAKAGILTDKSEAPTGADDGHVTKSQSEAKDREGPVDGTSN